jgi:cysteine-rich repeat protein
MDNRTIHRSSLLLACAILALPHARAVAAPSLVTTRPALAGNDFVDWSGFGPQGTPVPNLSTLSSNSTAVTVTVSDASGPLARIDQSSGWFGNFAPGAALLWSQVAGPMVIQFSVPVSAAGAQIQADSFGPFTAQIDVFDPSSSPLASFMVPGNSDSNGDDSAIFVGVQDTNATIKRIEYHIVGNGDFSINRLDLLYNPCGDGVTDSGEQCDDGNTANGDCCDASCQFEASGSPCPADGDVCTQDVCDGAGNCSVSGPRTSCGAAGKSLLLLKNNSDDQKDKLVWKWLKGAATTLADLGLPTGTTNYTLCLYSGTSSATVALPAGPNWTPLGTKGFKYKDPAGSPDGAQKATLKSGAAAKAKALVKGKGTNLPDLVGAPALVLPVTAQLVNDANSVCFGGAFDAGDVLKNDARQFKAKAQ